MRRPGPRPLAATLDQLKRDRAPATTLARVQGCWEGVAGAALASQATPVSERAGTLTLACRSSVWASEVQLLGPDLIERLNRALGDPEGATLKTLRVRVTAAG